MVQNVTIPLSWANNIFGVSDIQDVTFDIPQLEDIRQEIDDALPQLEEIADETADRVFDGFTTAFPQFEALLSFGQEIEEQADPGEDPITVLAQAIGAEIAEDVLQVEITGPEVDEGLIPALADAVAERVQTIQLDVDRLADRISDRIDVEGGGTAQVRFEGVFGPLSEDIQEGVTGALNAVLGDIDDLPEDIQTLAEGIDGVLSRLDDLDDGLDLDVQGAVEDALTAVEPTVDGAGLFSQPVEFIANVIVQAINDRVPDDVQTDLEEAVEGLE